jgi:hypothetical protein
LRLKRSVFRLSLPTRFGSRFALLGRHVRPVCRCAFLRCGTALRFALGSLCVAQTFVNALASLRCARIVVQLCRVGYIQQSHYHSPMAFRSLTLEQSSFTSFSLTLERELITLKSKKSLLCFSFNVAFGRCFSKWVVANVFRHYVTRVTCAPHARTGFFP